MAKIERGRNLGGELKDRRETEAWPASRQD